jgi:hypothetical protein
MRNSGGAKELAGPFAMCHGTERGVPSLLANTVGSAAGTGSASKCLGSAAWRSEGKVETARTNEVRRSGRRLVEVSELFDFLRCRATRYLRCAHFQ